MYCEADFKAKFFCAVCGELVDDDVDEVHADGKIYHPDCYENKATKTKKKDMEEDVPTHTLFSLSLSSLKELSLIHVSLVCLLLFFPLGSFLTLFLAGGSLPQLGRILQLAARDEREEKAGVSLPAFLDPSVRSGPTAAVAFAPAATPSR